MAGTAAAVRRDVIDLGSLKIGRTRCPRRRIWTSEFERRDSGLHRQAALARITESLKVTSWLAGNGFPCTVAWHARLLRRRRRGAVAGAGAMRGESVSRCPRVNGEGAMIGVPRVRWW